MRAEHTVSIVVWYRVHCVRPLPLKGMFFCPVQWKHVHTFPSWWHRYDQRWKSYWPDLKQAVFLLALDEVPAALVVKGKFLFYKPELFSMVLHINVTFPVVQLVESSHRGLDPPRCSSLWYTETAKGCLKGKRQWKQVQNDLLDHFRCHGY